jgi:hypothetical protein
MKHKFNQMIGGSSLKTRQNASDISRYSLKNVSFFVLFTAVFYKELCKDIISCEMCREAKQQK